MAELPPSETAHGEPARGAAKALEPPYLTIADLLASGGVVPFLGAGASQTNRNGNWTEDAAFYPLGSELARHLASKTTFPDSEPEHVRGDLARMASFAEHVQLDRMSLSREIRKIFCRKLEPGGLHRMLARIEKPIIIITTNYYTLLEQAFEEMKRPFHLITEYHGNKLWHREPGREKFDEQVPRKIDINFEENDAPVIYKMHGSVDIENKKNDYFLITEEDYVDFLASQGKGMTDSTVAGRASHAGPPAPFPVSRLRAAGLELPRHAAEAAQQGRTRNGAVVGPSGGIVGDREAPVDKQGQ